MLDTSFHLLSSQVSLLALHFGYTVPHPEASSKRYSEQLKDGYGAISCRMPTDIRSFFGGGGTSSSQNDVPIDKVMIIYFQSNISVLTQYQQRSSQRRRGRSLKRIISDSEEDDDTDEKVGDKKLTL